MLTELWFAKIHTNSNDEPVLNLGKLKILKETPKRWYVEQATYDQRALSGYTSYIPKDGTVLGSRFMPIFYASNKKNAVELLLERVVSDDESAQKKARRLAEQREKLAIYLANIHEVTQ